MYTIETRNVNTAVPRSVSVLLTKGVERTTRNGVVLEVQQPVTTYIQRPQERVNFWAVANIDPFVTLFEGLWMLDGKRGTIELDENPMLYVEALANLLRESPSSREAIMAMWCPDYEMADRLAGRVDLGKTATFRRNPNGILHMVVNSRGHNVFRDHDHCYLTMLQEFVAAWIGCPVGRYWHVCSNWHGHVQDSRLYFRDHEMAFPSDSIANGRIKAYSPPHPLVTIPVEKWRQELSIFLSGGMVIGIKDPFFKWVAGPMMRAHAAVLEKNYELAMEHLATGHECDWIQCAREWVTRRGEKDASPAIRTNG